MNTLIFPKTTIFLNTDAMFFFKILNMYGYADSKKVENSLLKHTNQRGKTFALTY